MLYTVPEAAQVLRVTPARLYALIRARVLPAGVAVRLARQVRIRSEALDEWMRQGGRGLRTEQGKGRHDATR